MTMQPTRLAHYPNSPCYHCGGSFQTLNATDATLMCCTSCGLLITKRKAMQSFSNASRGNSFGRSHFGSIKPVETVASMPKQQIKRSASSSATSIAKSTAGHGPNVRTEASSGRAAKSSTATADCTSTPLQLRLMTI